LINVWGSQTPQLGRSAALKRQLNNGFGTRVKSGIIDASQLKFNEEDGGALAVRNPEKARTDDHCRVIEVV